MGDDATKTVIKTLKAYLHKELPLDKDFFHELNSRGFLASNTAREIVMLADQGKQDCVWKLVTYMDQFYTEEMLQKLCAFLEEYAKPARPKLATIAARIRQEISKHKLQPVHELTPEDPQRGTSRARADVDVTVVKSVSDLMPYYMDMTAHLFELAAALEVVELSRALIDGSGTPQSKCLQILSHWLESTPSPTWALLCQKLRLVSSFKAVVHKIARDHNLPTAAHTVPGTFVPATFPPGSSSPEPPAPYTPAPTTLSPGTSVPGPTAPGAPMSSPPSYTSDDGTSSADMSQHDVYLPVIDDLKALFSTLAGNVLSIIDSLSSNDLKTFCHFLSNYLKPSFPPDAPLPVIPETFPVLKLFLIRCWDSLQIRLLRAVVEHLAASSNIQDATFKVNVQQVKADMNAYEDLLKGKLPEFLSKCRSESVSLISYPGQSSVSVKIDSKPEEISLARIIKLKSFFIYKLGLPDTLFTGFSEGCTVLFFSIPTECVWSLPSCLHPSNLSLLEEWKVLFFSVKGAFTVDIKERRVIDSLDKHSLLSSLSEYKTLNDDLRLRVQYVEKDLYFKEEELRVMEREVKVLRKGKGKALTTDQEIEEKVSFKEEPVVKTELSPYPDIKTEPSPEKSEPSSKRFKTEGPDYLTYEPPLEKNAEAEKHSLLSSLAEYKTLNDDLRLRVQYVEKDLHFKEEKLREMEGEVKALRKGKGKAVTTVQKPPRNWREMKCQKTLECGGVCWSIAVQGDVICVGLVGRVLLFSKTSGAQFRELGSDQIKGTVYGVAFIDEDTIVVSADKRLITYTTKGQLVRTFDSGKDGFTPRGLTVGPDGHIFVCDWHNDCVCVFNVDGKLLSSFGSEGSGVGQFKYPWDVCMDGEGLLFICDMYNSRICVHSVEGAFIREFPTPRRPYCVAATHCNHLVVSSESSQTHTVMIMTPSGQLVHEFGGLGSGPGQFSCPEGVAVDNEDCVYVCDAGNYRVQVY